MKSFHTVATFLELVMMLFLIVPGSADATNPIQKVLELLEKMEQEILHDGEARQKGYAEVSDMCRDRSVELTQEIKLAKSQVEDSKATIDKATDDEAEFQNEIEEFSSVLSNAEADLKAAMKIRQSEAANFAVDQKDLIDTISQMERSISILEKQQKGAASLAQLPVSVQKGALQVQKQRAAALAESFAAIIDSSSLNAADTQRLSSLIQTSEGDSDSEAAEATEGDAAELAAAEESYTTGAAGPENAGSIVETLENLLDQAQAQLETARSKETKARFNSETLKQSLEHKVLTAQNGMMAAKGALGEAGQTRAEAEGSIEITSKDLAEDVRGLNDLHHQCMSKATDFEAEVKSRAEELKALGEAKKVIKESTAAGEADTYGEGGHGHLSFIQAKSQSHISSSSPTVRAVRLVRDLGKRQHLPALMQMAHKMELLVRNSAVSGADPFSKVKTMLSTMLDHLVKQMQAEASHKVYCDKETSDTTKSKAEKESAVEKLSFRIDTQSSETLKLRTEVAALQKEILAIMKTQQQMDSIRKEENALYDKTKPELQRGQNGIKQALQVLRQYYSQDEESDDKSHEAKEGAGASIISILEVVESDFAKGVANMDEEEEGSKSAYKKATEENQLAKAVKEQDMTGKNKAIKTLGKVTSESSTDLDGVQAELDAVNEYYAKIQVECVAQATPYEDRRKRHEATMSGLKDAMQILTETPTLVQQGARQLRGSASHQASEPEHQVEG